ncbi:MAG: hypothetical protein J6V84_01190 [Clostridia bacterium]|nr:hypothetical protein [Clostridia bacterium]
MPIKNTFKHTYKSIYIASALCLLALIVMTVALLNAHNKAEFTPPAFESQASPGMPSSDILNGVEKIQHEDMPFYAYVCGELNVDADSNVDVWLINPQENTVWLKLRVYEKDGTLLAETGLLKPGEYIRSVKFEHAVENGDEILLKLMSYQPETYFSMGEVILNTVVHCEE